MFAEKQGIKARDEITFGIRCQIPSDLDYNFSGFEGAKQQECKCGTKNCRRFIDKRPPPSKPGPNKKGKKVGKRLDPGRITKVSPKKANTKTNPDIAPRNGKKRGNTWHKGPRRR